MLKYENGGFVEMRGDDVVPGIYESSLEEVVKQAGFEPWGNHGNSGSLELIIYRRYRPDHTNDEWLIDISDVTGGYSVVYCANGADFMGCLVAMGPLLCAAQVGVLTSALEMAAMRIGMRKKEPHWGVDEMVHDVLAPLVSWGK